MRNLLLTISYKGTNYHGFQVQKNAITVSGVIQKEIEQILNHEVQIKGCSRTDSGVHANKYCLSFKTNRDIKCVNLVRALNTKLPVDIAAIKCEDVDLKFHARYNCKKKEYIYKIWNEEYPSPFLSDLAYHYKYPLDEKMLDIESKDFIGTYDFKSFCNFKKDRNMEDTVRTVFDCNVTREGSLVIFKVFGGGFLYNMVRIMVGTLIFINEKKIDKGKIPYIIEQKDRSLAGKTAAAKGLYLNNIYY